MERVDKIPEPSAQRFERAAADSLLNDAAHRDRPMNTEQQRLLEATELYFAGRFEASRRR